MSMQKEVSSAFTRPITIGLATFLLGEVIAALYCWWQLTIYKEWQRADQSLLNESPDAYYFFKVALENFQLSRGFLFGVLFSALVLALFFCSKKQYCNVPHRIMLFSAVALPFFALIFVRA